MQASDYLKMKFQSDRQLAIYGQQGVASTWYAIQGIGTDIYSGVERASWYSSCLIPSYHDVCLELLSEEKRMLYSIRSIYRYRNVIGHMLYLYFKLIIGDAENGNKESEVQKLDTKIAGIVASMPAGKTTRLGLAIALSESLSASGLMSQAVVERLATRVPSFLWLFQLFGTDQKCAYAARRLKTLEPDYYAVLYNAELEMLYYFIEPVLSEVIKNVKMKAYRDFEEIYNDIKGKYNV